MAQPIEVLELVRDCMLTAQPNRTSFSNVAAFTSTSRTLREIKPSGLQTQWLGHALERRPSVDDVRAMGVLRYEFDSRRADLNKAIATTIVSKRLRQRPKPAWLLERGVLKAEPGTSPAIINARERLRRELAKQAVKRSLSPITHV